MGTLIVVASPPRLFDFYWQKFTWPVLFQNALPFILIMCTCMCTHMCVGICVCDGVCSPGSGEADVCPSVIAVPYLLHPTKPSLPCRSCLRHRVGFQAATLPVGLFPWVLRSEFPTSCFHGRPFAAPYLPSLCFGLEFE